MPLKLLSGLTVRCIVLSPFAKRNEFSSYIKALFFCFFVLASLSLLGWLRLLGWPRLLYNLLYPFVATLYYVPDSYNF